ncbi:MAG: HNH endonuclease [Pirellulaceae bacterium]|nr:HNH endonuclease [Pirellulaceae bacterium]
MSQEARYFYINTNSGFLGYDPFYLWYEHSLAISDGEYELYGAPLGNLRPGDILLAYTTKVGVVGIGAVQEKWDGKSHSKNKLTQWYPKVNEYRIGVNWFVDCRENPISGIDAIGYTVPKFFQEIVSGREKARKLIKRLIGTERKVNLSGNSQSKKEGRATVVLVSRYERDPQLRKACIKHFGYKCQICGFDFKDVYGEVGKNFIEVHHLLPLSKKSVRKTNPIKDLLPVCSNCHSMIHRKTPEYSVKEIKQAIAKHRR